MRVVGAAICPDTVNLSCSLQCRDLVDEMDYGHNPFQNGHLLQYPDEIEHYRVLKSDGMTAQRFR